MRFKKGSKVEILSKKEAPSGSWHRAEIICGNGHTYTVRYNEGAADKTVVERVSRKAIRPLPPLEDSENWVPGDIVEVFHDGSWKMATISQVLGKKYVLIRLLGSSWEFKVSKLDIRARQSWQGDQWIVIGKGPRNHENGKPDEILEDNQNSSFQVQKTNKRINSHADDQIPVRNKLKLKESQIVLSQSRKRASPYCYSQADANAGAPQKFRVVENEGRCHRVIASNPSVLAEQVKMDVERRKSSEDAASLASSVGSCSASSNNACRSPRHISASPIDRDNNSSDAQSCCRLRYKEGNFPLPPMEDLALPLPPKEDLAAQIHALELHAYRCTIEALYASGPLSWEQEELITNLRLSLHISNDEHLLEIRNLVSADTSLQFR
ncbi:hypothetical protein UlMin_045792 [Ulmus minor]